MGLSCITVFATVILTVFNTVSCMECELGHEASFVEKLDFVNPKSCPTIFGDDDKKYCCVQDHRVYCCDAAEFFGNGFGVLLPVLIAVAVGFFVACCLCCLCCPCCCLYKRRNRGTVYGRVQQQQATVLSVSSQQQAPAYPPQPIPSYQPQPGAHTSYPPLQGQLPPPYSEAPLEEAYTKQAPYNPNFH